MSGIAIGIASGAATQSVINAAEQSELRKMLYKQ